MPYAFKRPPDTEYIGSPLQNNMFGAWPFLQNPVEAPIDGLGGAKDRNTPMVTGTGNRRNQWGPYPYICGSLRVYPVVVAGPNTTVDGVFQRAQGVLTFGFGRIALADLKVGDKFNAEVEGFTYGLYPGASPGEGPFDHYGDIEEEIVGKELPYGKSVVVTAPQVATTIQLDIQFDNGLQKIVPIVDLNRNVIYQKQATSVTIQVYVRPSGQPHFVFHSNNVITASTERTWRQTISLTVAQGQYDVMVVRAIPADSTDPNLIDACSLATIRAIKPGVPLKPAYTKKGNQILLSFLPWSAIAGQKTNGELGEINGLAQRYVPTWNGSVWTFQHTQAPSYYFLDALTGQAFNEQVDRETEVDLPSIHAWTAECEAKGYKINYVFDSETEIGEALSLICKTGRAKWFHKDGKYSVAFDGVRSTQAQTFTERNSRDYSGNRARSILPNAFLVRFRNELNDFKEDCRIVYWDGVGPETTTGLVVEEMDMPGVTHPDLIYKHARYELAVMRLRPETHEVTVDLQHLTCNVGDLVRVVNKNGLLGLGGALITEVITNEDGDVTSVTVDQSFLMVPGSTYDFEIRLSDGTFLTKTLVTVEGEHYTFDFAEPIPAEADLLPAVGDLVACGLTGEIGAQMIVQSIAHQPNFEARITMQPYSPSIFSADTGPVPPFDSNVTFQHDAIWRLPKPQYLTIRSDESVLLRMSNGSLQSRIVIAMAPPSDIRVTHFQCEYKLATSNAWLAGDDVRIEQGQVVIPNVEDAQTYSIRVRNYVAPGKASDWLDIPDHTVIGKTTKPPAVAAILRLLGTSILRARLTTVPPDYDGLRWFYCLGSMRIRARASVFENLAKGEQVDTSTLPKTIISVGVVMVDVAGNESGIIAWTTFDNGPVDTSNIVETFDYHPTFPGTHNGVIADDKLCAQDNGEGMWSDNGNVPMWSNDGDTPMWEGIYQDLIWDFPFVPDFSYADTDFKLIMRYGEELIVEAPQGYLLEFRRPGSTLMWSEDGDTPMWDEDGDTPMWDADDPRLPWTGELTGHVEELQMRLTLYGGPNQPRVVNASMKIDVPDVVATIDDAVIEDTGTRLSLPVEFRVIKNINVTLQYSGDHPDAFTWRVVDKNAVLGPLIEILDSEGNLTSGIVDVTLRGY